MGGGVHLVFLAGASVGLLSVLIGTAMNAVGAPLGAPGLSDNNRILFPGRSDPFQGRPRGRLSAVSYVV